MIPKKLHVIWIGDEYKRPDHLIDTWREKNPTFSFKIWGNDEYESIDWVNRRHMETFWRLKKWTGVADLMRYEILFRNGGIYVDADSRCLRPLDERLLNVDCWMVRSHREDFVSNAFIGCTEGHPLMLACIKAAEQERTVDFSYWSWRRLKWKKMTPWNSVGPRLLTKCLDQFGRDRVCIWPTHMFIPTSKEGYRYEGNDPVYCDHEWGTTKNRYVALGEQPTSQSLV